MDNPAPFAYRLDTLVINAVLDTLPRPLPSLIRLSSLRAIGLVLDVNASGKQQAYLKRAFHQNASAYIVATLRYRSRDGIARRLEAGFTRYSVIFLGERLPDGTPADAVYIHLTEEYRDLLNHAPVRPLDYTYLKALTPTAQRFYEMVSYKMFAALTHRHAHATLRYTDYCLLAPQQRHTDYEQVKKQMYKVHRPHLASGYLARVHYTATTDTEGQPDWLLHYMPGPKARAEYAAFMRQPGVAAASALPPAEDLSGALVAPLAEASRVTVPSSRSLGVRRPTPPATDPAPPAAGIRDAEMAPASLPAIAPATPPEPAEKGQPDPAVALVQAFYQCFHGLRGVTPRARELAQARQLLAAHGPECAQFLLAFAHQAAQATHYAPQVFGGILQYTARALAAYDARQQQAQAQQTAGQDAAQHEAYDASWRQAVDELRAACTPEELVALEAEARARLGTLKGPAEVRRLRVRIEVDALLAARAQLPDRAAWLDWAATHRRLAAAPAGPPVPVGAGQGSSGGEGLV